MSIHSAGQLVTPDTRHLTASVVVIDVSAEKVLLVGHRATGKLMFPGGHVDDDEDPGAAAVREVLEETGIAVLLHTPQLLGLPGMRQLACPWLVYEIPAPAKPDRGPGKPAEPAHRHIDLLFLADHDSSDEPTPQPGEVYSVGWADIATLDELDVRAEVPTVARIALARLRGVLIDDMTEARRLTAGQ